jgi:hypothetical protein
MSDRARHGLTPVLQQIPTEHAEAIWGDVVEPIIHELENISEVRED